MKQFIKISSLSKCHAEFHGIALTLKGLFKFIFDCMCNYKESLLDPRWQKKRLEVMSEDGWKCMFCNSTKNTLTVHHIKYIQGRKVWDYPNNLLITLCLDCHDFIHEKGRWAWIKDYERSKLR